MHKAVLSIESADFQIDNELKLVLPLYPDPKVVVINNSDNFDKDIYDETISAIKQKKTFKPIIIIDKKYKT